MSAGAGAGTAAAAAADGLALEILEAVRRTGFAHLARREAVAALLERGLDISTDDLDRAWQRCRRGRLIGQGAFAAVLTPRGIAALERLRARDRDRGRDRGRGRGRAADADADADADAERRAGGP